MIPELKPATPPVPVGTLGFDHAVGPVTVPVEVAWSTVPAAPLEPTTPPTSPLAVTLPLAEELMIEAGVVTPELHRQPSCCPTNPPTASLPLTAPLACELLIAIIELFPTSPPTAMPPADPVTLPVAKALVRVMSVPVPIR